MEERASRSFSRAGTPGPPLTWPSALASAAAWSAPQPASRSRSTSERKRREIDPILEVLRLCIAELDKNDPKDDNTRERLREIYEFFGDVEALYSDIRQFPVSTIRGIVRARGTVRKLLSRKRRR